MSICSAMYTDHAFLQHLQTPISPNWSGMCDLLLATDDLLNCAHTASRKSMRWLWTKEKKGWSQNQHMKVISVFFLSMMVQFIIIGHIFQAYLRRDQILKNTSYWGKAPVELLGLLEQRPKEPGRKQPLAIGARHWLPTHSTV